MLTAEGVGVGTSGLGHQVDGRGRRGQDVGPTAEDAGVGTSGPLGCSGAGPPATQQFPPHALPPSARSYPGRFRRFWK